MTTILRVCILMMVNLVNSNQKKLLNLLYYSITNLTNWWEDEVLYGNYHQKAFYFAFLSIAEVRVKSDFLVQY